MAIDMLVALDDLKDPVERMSHLSQMGINIRRAVPKEAHGLGKWVKDNFSEEWASECGIAMTRILPSCFVATQGGSFVGFARFDVSYKGSLGPMGVTEPFSKEGYRFHVAARGS